MNKTTMWILGILASISIAATGYSVARVDTVQTEAAKTFLTITQYNKDQSELCVALRDIVGAISDLDKKSEQRAKDTQTIIRQHERESIIRYKAK